MTPDDALALIDGHVAAAAAGAAFEQGLFWLLSDEPRPTEIVAEELGMPVEQCRFWLEHLTNLGLLDRGAGGYATSAGARGAILDSYSRETWSFLARSAREELSTVIELSSRLAEPPTPLPAEETTPPDYVAKMREDPDRAREFTRMLYEIHLPLAEELAATTPTGDGASVLDVGGGSGVMSLALLRHNPSLVAVVVDLATVCVVGREIAAENALSDRIEYRAMDFVADDLPTGFDMILFCDVGGYSENLLRDFHSSLEPGGRLIIVDKFGPAPGLPHPSRSHWALLGSLHRNAPRRVSIEDVANMLNATGFDLESRMELPERVSRWSSGWTRIVARA